MYFTIMLGKLKCNLLLFTYFSFDKITYTHYRSSYITHSLRYQFSLDRQETPGLHLKSQCCLRLHINVFPVQTVK